MRSPPVGSNDPTIGRVGDEGRRPHLGERGDSRRAGYSRDAKVASSSQGFIGATPGAVTDIDFRAPLHRGDLCEISSLRRESLEHATSGSMHPSCQKQVPTGNVTCASSRTEDVFSWRGDPRSPCQAGPRDQGTVTTLMVQEHPEVTSIANVPVS